MLQPENQAKKYQHLFTGIDTGKIRIPQFQRNFVWNKIQTAKLIDSIIKGFPIGTFILWESSDEMRTVRNIGNADLPNPKRGEVIQYVLDGQQRITSLYAVQKGLVNTYEGKQIDYKDICINLDQDPDAEEEVVTTDPPESAAYISVYELLNGNITAFVTNFPDPAQLHKIDIYRNRLTSYDFSTILMPGYPIDIACEVFTRINTGGTELNLFEIMVAKTYDLEKKFDLADEYNSLIDNNGAAEKDLEDADYDTLPPSTVLQCVAAHLSRAVRRKDILKLDKAKFIESWPKVKDGLFAAVDYLRTDLGIPVSQLLPYNTLLVPLTYFFLRNGGKSPSAKQNRWLQQYFWWASLTSRFSQGTEGKVALDFDRMDKILQEEAPDYRGQELKLSIDDLRWRWFSASDGFCKAILCLYAYFIPRSFKNGGLVKIDNSWLKQVNSKNYHHFFPRSYLCKKRGYADWQANCIVNITIVDDFLNKQKIRSRAPSDYMREFEKGNTNLLSTMRTHLVDDLDAFGVWDDDYEKFIESRATRILEELNRRLYPAGV